MLQLCKQWRGDTGGHFFWNNFPGWCDAWSEECRAGMAQGLTILNNILQEGVKTDIIDYLRFKFMLLF